MHRAIDVADEQEGRWRVPFKKLQIRLVISVLVIPAIGCAAAQPKPSVLEPVYLSAKTLETTLETQLLPSLTDYRQLVQAFARETSIAQDRAQSNEREALDAYRAALARHLEALRFWETLGQLSGDEVPASPDLQQRATALAGR
ncbi:MAG: hypothetical protein DMF89_25695 [Acidobacteria bacterium]|nr:MAG: hypothetical protein DMF89_25695 [Acidobacteriota bacterium]